MSKEEHSSEVQRLSAEIEILTRRVATLERASLIPLGDVGDLPKEETQPQTDDVEAADGEGASRLFVRGAWICSCLIGALILRVVTQNGLIGAMPGTIVGLGYCTLLVSLPVLLRKQRSMSAHGFLMEYCGTVLAPLIVLETFHKESVFSAAMSAVILTGFAIFSAVVNSALGHKALTAIALTLATASIPALGFNLDGLQAKAILMVVIVACAAVIAARRNWKALQPIVFPLAAMLLGFTVLVTAHREGLAPTAAHTVMGAVFGLFLVIAANHTFALSKLSAPESAWLPIATLWSALLFLYYSPQIGASSASVAAVLMIVSIYVFARRTSTMSAGVLGVGASAAMAGSVGFPVLDPTGSLLALTAVVLLFAARRCRSAMWAVLAQLQIMVAMGVGLSRGGLTDLGAPLTAWKVGAGAALTAIAFSAYYISICKSETEEDKIPGRLASPISLVVGVVALFFTGRLCAHHLLGDTPMFQLSLTILLAILCAASQIVAKRLENKAIRNAGFLGMAIMTAKVLLSDLLSLSAGHAVVSLGMLTAIFVLTSILFRKSSAKTEPADHAKKAKSGTPFPHN